MATKSPSPTTDPAPAPGPTQHPLRRSHSPVSARGSTPTAPSSSSSAMKPTKSVRSKVGESLPATLSTDFDNQVGGQKSCGSNRSSDLEYLANEIDDLVLQPRYDGVNGPKMVSFSDFLRIVASESERQPRRRQPIGALPQDDRNVCSLRTPSPPVEEEPKGDVLVKSSPEKADAALAHAIMWEGTIHLTWSSLTNVVAIFKSGEKPSTNEWPRSLEIKKRVSLGVFEKLLGLLRESRKRTIMVTELRWKEGSIESGRHHLLKTIESYTANERVGLVKPTEEVELFLCPYQGKAAQILADNLLKELWCGQDPISHLW
ncbi:uncharacterized protein [Triticum aestivum]|uniref:uncharacterized protein isoform X2 n=1 Tax=Triticum aestivum TaxID=4565 RepID=UPI001D0303E7|nr:uncharacterized protein LOC123149846 isoform X2 [Triticum aestivum]